MQKIRKFLGAVSEKTALPTNQPTNQLLPTTPTLWDFADAVPNNLKYSYVINKMNLEANKKLAFDRLFGKTKQYTKKCQVSLLPPPP